jgi:hypothetical protein
MTPLAHGSAGLALALCFGLLRTRQDGITATLLLLQSLFVAFIATAGAHVILACIPVLLALSVWIIHDRTERRVLSGSASAASPVTMVIGCGLAALSLSQGAVSGPLAMLLLGVLLAATRTDLLAPVTAMVVAQNAIVVLACQSTQDDLLLPCAGLLLVAPVLLPVIGVRRRLVADTAVAFSPAWIGWVRFVAAIGLLLTTILVPLDPLAAVFAPLLAFDGAMRAWAQRRRRARPVNGHAIALLRTTALVLSVAGFNPLTTWFCVTAAAVLAILPAHERLRSALTLTCCAAAFTLFGTMASLSNPVVGALCLIMGTAMLAALVPDMAVPLMVTILRLSNAPGWPSAAAWLCDGIAIGGLLACAVLIRQWAAVHRLALLHLAQAAIALLAIGLNNADGRYAAMTLLVLLTLTRAASRFGSDPAAIVARIGLSGLSPIGVFPALVLVVLAVSGQGPWLLVPLGIGLSLITPAALPARLPAFRPADQLLSAAWLPLALALMFGFFAPDPFAHWLRMVTARPS